MAYPAGDRLREPPRLGQSFFFRVFRWHKSPWRKRQPGSPAGRSFSIASGIAAASAICRCAWSTPASGGFGDYSCFATSVIRFRTPSACGSMNSLHPSSRLGHRRGAIHHQSQSQGPQALLPQPFSPGSTPVLSPRNGSWTSTRFSIASQRLFSGVSLA